MNNKEKTYATDWKFFKNYIIYVNERNRKNDEGIYQKDYTIGLLEQSQKKLNLLSSRIAKSLYTLGIHNSYLEAIDLDFLNKYIKLDKPISEYESYKLNITSGFRIEDKRISFLIYIMASFFHINNLHNTLSPTEDNFDILQFKDYNIHQLYLDDLFLYTLLKSIKLIKQSRDENFNFINKLVEEYNTALDFYKNRINKLYLNFNNNNYITAIIYIKNSIFYNNIKNAYDLTFSKKIISDIENNDDIREYYSNFDDNDIIFMINIVCNLFTPKIQIDNYKRNTLEYINENHLPTLLKNKFEIKVTSINIVIALLEEKLSSILSLYPDDNSTLLILEYIELLDYCRFLLTDLKSELKKFTNTCKIKMEINSILNYINQELSSLKKVSSIFDNLLLSETYSSRKKLINKLASLKECYSSIKGNILNKLKTIYTKTNNIESDSLFTNLKEFVKTIKTPSLDTDVFKESQSNCFNKFKNSTNKYSTLLSFIELFNLEQYTTPNSLVIINPDIENIYWELNKCNINNQSEKKYHSPFTFIKSIL